ncbi:MAG: leucyl aminopeptidase [Pseudomonadota bacterium]|nr:leucyl aminopeptidase [Pseudomonadota bacterium]
MMKADPQVTVRKARVDATPDWGCLGIFVFAGERGEGAENWPLGEESRVSIRRILDRNDWAGKAKRTTVVLHDRGPSPFLIALIGLGKREEFNLERLRDAAARAGKASLAHGEGRLAIFMDPSHLGLPGREAGGAVAEGAILGPYSFSAYKTLDREEEEELQALTILVPKWAKLRAIRTEVAAAETICRAVNLARDLTSMPANELTPSVLAEKAQALAAGRARMKTTILSAPEMKRLGMNALLGVASGSDQEPKFIVLSYSGAEAETAPIVFVGKALTFDSGGISLKPAEKMDEMKSDMAGGAAVLAAVLAAADLGLPVDVLALVPATENMPGGKAYRPGDILRSMSGKTIEVVNTDAEGRLILADALHYASRFEPAAVIDVATLTGACVVALGERVAGLMGTDGPLKEEIKHAAEQTGEMVWELPLWENYQEQIKSEVADFKNSAGRMGGAITAAAFLSKFVGPYPWAHLDIAGPAWLSKEAAYRPKGATGVGVRLLVRLLRNRSGR